MIFIRFYTVFYVVFNVMIITIIMIKNIFYIIMKITIVIFEVGPHFSNVPLFLNINVWPDFFKVWPDF